MKFKLAHMRRPRLIAMCTIGLLSHAGLTTAQEQQDNSAEGELEEIIIEGIPLDLTIKEIAQPTAVISGDELSKNQAGSIGETLSKELGVSSSYFGPVASRPVIRGQSGERIRVLSNSLDSMDASALSEDHAVGIDTLLAERIEIIRGPATLLYGSGAAGGLVNVIDHTIESERMEVPYMGTVVLDTDSATGRRAAAGEVAFSADAFNFHFDYFTRDTDDVDIPGFAESALFIALEEAEDGGDDEEGEEEAFGTVENTSSDSDGGAAGVTWVGDNGYVGLSFRTYNSLYGIPGGHHHEEGEDEAEEEEEELISIDLNQKRFDLQGGYQIDQLGELQFKVARNDYEHTELEGDEIGTVFESEGTDIRVELQHRPYGAFEGAFGFQHKDIDFVAIGEEAFVPPSSTQQTSAFLFETWQPNDQWTFQGSARLEHQSIDTPELENYDENAFGLSVGFIRLLDDDHSIALNYALTQRHPNTAELYSEGPHLAVQRFELGSVVQGDGLLDKETSSNIDLTVRGENPMFEWTVTAFLNDVNDYILLNPTDQIEDDLQVFEYVQTDARLYGLEAEARIELMDSASGHLHTRLFTDYVYGEDDNTGEYLPRISPLRYGIGFDYTKGNLSAGIDARFHSDQDKVSANELPTDSYTLVTAELSYTFANPDVFVFVRGNNITDEEARQHASPLKDLIPLPGRSVQLGLRYDF